MTQAARMKAPLSMGGMHWQLPRLNMQHRRLQLSNGRRKRKGTLACRTRLLQLQISQLASLAATLERVQRKRRRENIHQQMMTVLSRPVQPVSLLWDGRTAMDRKRRKR